MPYCTICKPHVTGIHSQSAVKGIVTKPHKTIRTQPMTANKTAAGQVSGIVWRSISYCCSGSSSLFSGFHEAKSDRSIPVAHLLLPLLAILRSINSHQHYLESRGTPTNVVDFCSPTAERLVNKIGVHGEMSSPAVSDDRCRQAQSGLPHRLCPDMPCASVHSGNSRTTTINDHALW